MKKRLFSALLLCLFASTAFAAEPLLHEANIYIGGGVSSNDANNTDSAVGLQLFVGYDLPVKVPHSVLSAEIGYWDSGDMDKNKGPGNKSYDGIYANGVIAVHLSESIDFLGRMGLDFGDDDGFMAGVGLGVNLSPAMALRFEYVSRDKTDSLQANFVFHF